MCVSLFSLLNVSCAARDSYVSHYVSGIEGTGNLLETCDGTDTT